MKLFLILSALACANSFAPSSFTHVNKQHRNVVVAVQSQASSNNNNHNNDDHDPLTRLARIQLPLLTIAGILQGHPQPSHAKSSSSPKFDAVLKEQFPGCIPSNTALLRIQATLRKRQYFPYNTLLATSLPSDEMAHTPISLISQLRTKLCEAKDGGIYDLGGLCGIPFTGNAGMKALLSHTPKDGRLIIMFGPNVGVDKDGNVGQVEVIGRDSPVPTPRVVVDAYKSIMNGQDPTPSSSSGLNLEEEYIVKLLKQMPLKDYYAKGGDNYALAKVTQNLYGIIAQLVESQVMSLIDNQFWENADEVTLLGGIVIHRGHGSGLEGGDDLFQPYMMKTLVKGGVEVDLYKEVFGDLNVPRA